MLYNLRYMRQNRTKSAKKKSATVAEMHQLVLMYTDCLEALLFALRVGDVMNP